MSYSNIYTFYHKTKCELDGKDNAMYLRRLQLDLKNMTNLLLMNPLVTLLADSMGEFSMSVAIGP
jgi:hypothetical protein